MWAEEITPFSTSTVRPGTEPAAVSNVVHSSVAAASVAAGSVV